MKKTLLLLLPALLAGTTISKADEYVTTQSDKCYTFATLSEDAESGVEDLGDGVYVMNKSVKVSAGNTFDIVGAKCVKLADGVTLTLNCYCNFDAPEERVLFTRLSADDAPRGITVDYDIVDEAIMTFRNIDFEYASLKNVAQHGFDVDHCTFRYANGAHSSMGALNVGCDQACFNITNCTFEDNTIPAIGGAANYCCGLLIQDCTFVNNNTSNTNKPQINITVGGEQPVTITGCTITGSGLNMVGGIAVGNLTMKSGANVVNITNNTITDHRYGITGVGPMNMYIRDNVLLNNNHEDNPMVGGSGISLSGYGYELNAIVSGNHIENSLWGITIIYCNDVNLGEIGNPDSPGNNVFVNNGNNGVPYDLYNNQSNTVYAQNNTWSVPEQTAEEIEKVIYHSADDPSLGEVIYMPAREPSAHADVQSKGLALYGKTIISDTPVDIYDINGRCVVSSAMCPSLEGLAPGIYTARSFSKTIKFAVK